MEKYIEILDSLISSKKKRKRKIPTQKKKKHSAAHGSAWLLRPVLLAVPSSFCMRGFLSVVPNRSMLIWLRRKIRIPHYQHCSVANTMAMTAMLPFVW